MSESVHTNGISAHGCGGDQPLDTAISTRGATAGPGDTVARDHSALATSARTTVDDSYGESILRFDAPGVADKYPSEFGGSWRNRREARCVRRFVATLPANARVLDLPCGTGRLTPLLAERPVQIVGADSSPNMVDIAMANWRRRESPMAARSARFEVASASDTHYGDGAFDAIVCNRLFHHFRESATRIAVLREFRRICSGRILVSFFNSWALDSLRFRLKHFLRGTTPTDRIPIPMKTMVADVRAAGLRVLSATPVVWGISPMWYLELGDVRGAASTDRRRDIA